MKRELFLFIFAGIFALASCTDTSDIEIIENSSSSIYSSSNSIPKNSVLCQIGDECNYLSKELCNSYGVEVETCSTAQSSSSGEAVEGSSSSETVEGSSSSEAIESSSSISSSSVPQMVVVEMDIPKSGYYNSSGLTVTVPPETEQGIIRCDTTGAMPKADSQIQSGTELNITQNTILRCAYFNNDKISSRAILRSYITDRLPNLPIVSIAVNPDSMFNNSNALYRSGAGNSTGCSGATLREDEIPIHVELFEQGRAAQKNGPEWSYPAGIKIHGGCSRNWPKKSVIVSFREAYGQKELRYPLFPSHPQLNKFKHFMLRNNGNNWENDDYIRDMLMSSLTEGLDIDYQKGRAVVVYYNGNYYGIHNLRERANSDYFETNYGFNDKSINLVDVDGDDVREGSNDDYKQNVETWLNGISTLTDSDLSTLEQRIDVNNFTNHYQSRIFYRDCDWPGKNMKRWKQSDSRAKWRWLLFDTDHGFGSWGSSYLTDNNTNMMRVVTATNGSSWPNPPQSTLVLRKLLTNESYKNAFINRFSLLIATYFTSEKLSARISELRGAVTNEITYDKAKFKPPDILPFSSITSFASSRPTSMQNELKNHFSIMSDPVNLTLSVSGSGKILVHGLQVPNNNATFKAYPGVPITIEAVGSGFSGWSDGNKNAKRTVDPIIDTDIELTANF